MNLEKRHRVRIALVALLAFLPAMAQRMPGGLNADPVHVSVQQHQLSATEVEVVFTAAIDAGWHVYSIGQGLGGPTSATYHDEGSQGAKPVGSLLARGNEISVEDKVFDMPVRYFERQAVFVQRYRLTGGDYHIKGYLEYGACDNQMCLPPTSVEADLTGKGPGIPATSDVGSTAKADAPPAAPAVEAMEENVAKAVPAAADTASQPFAGVPLSDTVVAKAAAGDTALVASRHDLWWQPQVEALGALNGDRVTDRSWLYIFLMGFVGGLLALFTPCVWPIIPMTVSFFLKRSKDKRRGIRDALIYGASIVVIYLALGVVVTALFGAQQLNNLATNAIFNIFFFLLLVVFALSFFGWFELRLPSSWANKVDSKATNTTGLLSIFLMAFTLALVSFSCTAPIVGLLLVEGSTSGNWLGPAFGMLGFALALALPFTLFALFPAWLKQAPKSGSWMNRIKVTLGFIELAFALKFFSVADLAYGWHMMDREVFLSLWIAIFFLLGLYLIGVLRFQSDMVDGEPRKPMPVLCIMAGLCSLAFAVYMVPGLWGAPCKAVSAFAPPMSTQDFNLSTKEVRAQFNDYDAGMAYAAEQGKPVLLDFTGYGCVNCRKMEAAVWTDPTVADRLTRDFVLISLFVDDKTPLPEKVVLTRPDGSRKTLRTVGDKWSFLEETKFGYLTQPLYVIVDGEGRPLTRSFSYKEDVADFLKFLQEGKTEFVTSSLPHI